MSSNTNISYSREIESELVPRARETWSRDPLTQLPDSAWFTDMLQLETRRTAREEAPMSLLILGVDHFSSYNSLHGKAAADVCLQIIADSLRVRFQRAGDFIARLTGDEFGVILPNTSESTALMLGDRLVKTVHALGISHTAYAAREQEVLTISAGVATNHDHWDIDGKALWVVADQSMLRAKQAGGNRVASSTDYIN